MMTSNPIVEERLEAFEEWVAQEMGHTVPYIHSMREKTIFGGYAYRKDEINKRYRAYCAGGRQGIIK